MRKELIKILNSKSKIDLLQNLPEEVLSYSFYKDVIEEFHNAKSQVVKKESSLKKIKKENMVLERTFYSIERDIKILLKVGKRSLKITTNYLLYFNEKNYIYPYFNNKKLSCLTIGSMGGGSEDLSVKEFKQLMYAAKNPELMSFI